ncbi:MAG TPA: hypothetical protein VFQ88_12900 [Nevskiaceae bacterium]|nr:hypothetical protein [Nevskiaceae bacterium]
MTNTKLIQYVGAAPTKADNVRHTSRFWDKPLAVVEVPAIEAFSYLMHPSVWREVTAKQVAKEAKTAEQALDAVKALIGKLDAAGLAAVRDLVQSATPVEPEPAAPAAPRPEPSVEDVAKVSDVATMQAKGKRVQKIANAVKQLDPHNDGHYADGKPRVDIVRDITGLPDVSASEIAEAQPLVN